ncbi:hypothetical protein TRAPUB_12240 [Trametes pubescens]|uniref:Uncharacterized protein n=1 Tax=Trametes pubescens TaxID=154538 RepID=A0A1M2VUP8_TRAPU|nr:hypothetical protein TRAPUB_12240 [Trametes pubescens]
MSSPDIVPLIDAVAALSRGRDAVDVLCAELTLDLRQSLRALGLSADSSQWHDDVRHSMKILNREYRRDVKADVIDNGRKMRRTKGANELVLRVLDVARKFAASETQYSEFKTLYDAQRGRLVSAELFQYNDVLKTVENAMVAFKEQLTITRQRLASYLPAFRILEQPQRDVRAFTWRLDAPVSQRENIRAARSLLVRLVEVQGERGEIELRSGAMFVATSASFMDAPITPELVAAQVSKFEEIAAAIENCKTAQVEILAQLKEYFDDAGASPSSLAGIVPDTTVEVSTLRDAGACYSEILAAVELLHEINDSLELTISRVTSRLKHRVTVNKVVLAM